MRKTAVLLLFPMSLALAACNSGSQPAASGSAETPAGPATVANEVSGSVAVEKGENTPSDQAKLSLSLRDISANPNVVIAEKVIEPVGALPVQFKLPVDTARVVPGHVIVLVAEMVDGARHYTMPLQQAVLTHGSPSKVDITLASQPTKSENLLAAYHHMERQLGDMDVSSGKSRGDNGSRAWQVFTKNNHVQWIKDLEKSFETDTTTTTDYAYKDGKPWVVVRVYPDHIERAGWSKLGKLELRESEADGKVTELSKEDAKALLEDAKSELEKAQD